jgi:DNA-binding beta-propeller fold protein YncE
VSKVYVSDFANDLVYVLNNGASLTFDRTISVGDGPTGLALTADGRLLVAAWNAGLVQLVDLATDQVTGSANSRGPHPVAVIVQGQNAFVLNYGDPGVEDGSVSAYGLP